MVLTEQRANIFLALPNLPFGSSSNCGLLLWRSGSGVFMWLCASKEFVRVEQIQEEKKKNDFKGGGGHAESVPRKKNNTEGKKKKKKNTNAKNNDETYDQSCRSCEGYLVRRNSTVHRKIVVDCRRKGGLCLIIDRSRAKSVSLKE